MSKVGGALPSWYWPAGLPRRAPVPHQPLQLQLGRRVSRARERPALSSPRRSLTYGEFWADVLATGRALEALEATTVAVCEENGLEAVLRLLGALEAGRPVALLDPELAPERLAEQLAGAESSRRRARANEPVVLLGAGADMAVHSHASLSAMGVGLASFLPELRRLRFCWAGPVCSWEALTGVVAALQSGMPASFASAAELRGGEHGFADDGYTILRRADADAFIAAGKAPSILSRLRHVFVSTGAFTRRWRRRLERLLGRPILTLWGSQEVGPAVAAHPSWVPSQAHGIPLVNVNLIPIDPASGRVSLVPWELRERAGLGVESPSTMSGYTDPERTRAVRLGNIVRVPKLAQIDHVGAVTVHG
jgi:acyl-CoA synthetase (AMP-forming)/AMP-acid ligase II